MSRKKPLNHWFLFNPLYYETYYNRSTKENWFSFALRAAAAQLTGPRHLCLPGVPPWPRLPRGPSSKTLHLRVCGPGPHRTPACGAIPAALGSGTAGRDSAGGSRPRSPQMPPTSLAAAERGFQQLEALCPSFSSPVPPPASGLRPRLPGGCGDLPWASLCLGHVTPGPGSSSLVSVWAHLRLARRRPWWVVPAGRRRASPLSQTHQTV